MIKNIIFDLGNVLVGVDFEKAKNNILSAGVNKKKYIDFFNKDIRKKYETGKKKQRSSLILLTQHWMENYPRSN